MQASTSNGSSAYSAVVAGASSSSPTSRQCSPPYSDSEGSDHQPSSHLLPPGGSRSGGPQRPHLAHSNTATSGSFVRIKRKNTSSPSPVGGGAAHHAAQAIAGDGPAQASSSASAAVTTGSTDPSGGASALAHKGGERSVDQLAHKVCFICYEDESSGSATESGADLGSSSGHGPWIHPCKCSLMAHEDCLLQWISISKPTASKNVPVACPQCSAPYTINQLNFPLLNLIERIEGVWTRNIGKVLMVGAGLGSWSLLSLYGVWAIRKFAGDRVTDQLLMRRSTRWITAPLVLPIMVLSRTNLLDSILPFLPLTLVLNSTLPSTYAYQALEPYPLADLQIGFPPNPALTLCLLPWVRAVYTSLRRRIFHLVLGTKARRTPITSPGTPGLDGTPPAINEHGAPGVPLPGEADFAQNQQAQQNGRGNDPHAQWGAGVNAMLGGDLAPEERRIVLTVSSSMRLLAGSLIFPWAAATAGSLLFWLAKNTSNGRGLLAKILGVGVASTLAPLGGTFGTLFGLGGSLFQPAREFIDPVWWRNTVGGAAMIIGKDVGRLLRISMERKRAQSRRVQGQPIREGLEV